MIAARERTLFLRHMPRIVQTGQPQRRRIKPLIARDIEIRMTRPTFDQAALEVFTAEGAPSRQDPALPECVTGSETPSKFHPRNMPALRLACAVEPGAEQRYRMPLWRTFKGPGPARKG